LHPRAADPPTFLQVPHKNHFAGGIMADISARAAHCPEIALADFLSTVNQGDGTLTEIAFAKAGTSQFNRAVYYEHLSE
jgi:hypothetical protein